MKHTPLAVLAVAAAWSSIDAADLVWDQSSLPFANGKCAQSFEATRSTLDCQGADDFTNYDATSWEIGRIVLLGSYSNATASVSSINVTVLADAGGGPGSQVCETVGVVIDDDSGDLAIDLVTSCTIPPGTYWLAVQANLDYGADHDQWFWDSSESASGATARWRNPDAGFPTLCTDWETLPDCYGSGERSFLFALYDVSSVLFEDDFESGTTSAWSGVVP